MVIQTTVTLTASAPCFFHLLCVINPTGTTACLTLNAPSTTIVGLTRLLADQINHNQDLEMFHLKLII